jgi:hypothetical protein
MERNGNAGGQLLRTKIALLLLGVALVGPLGFAGTPNRPKSPESSALEAAPSWIHQGPVYSVALPYEEPVVPPGPNREQFKALCRLCHSPQLVLTQPRFPQKKWSEIVHKMVAVYGAPIPPDQEKPIVAYLTHVLGPEH